MASKNSMRGFLKPDDPQLETFKKRHFDKFLREIFLNSLAQHGSLTVAARAVGLTTREVRDLIDRDPSFALLCDQARHDAVESLRGEAFHRAKVSDKILIRLLECLDPGFDKRVTTTDAADPLTLSDSELDLEIERLRNRNRQLSPHDDHDTTTEET